MIMKAMALVCPWLLVPLISTIISGQQISSDSVSDIGSFDHSHHHHPNEWNVIDWWQQNIHDDLMERLYRIRFGHDHQNDAPIGHFVRAIEPQTKVIEPRFVAGHHQNDLEASASYARPQRVKFRSENNVTQIVEAKRQRAVPGESDGNRENPEVVDLEQATYHLIPKNHTSKPTTKPATLIPGEGLNRKTESPPSKLQEQFIPKATIASMKSLFYEYFTDIRSNLFDVHSYLNLKRQLRQKFIDYGLQTAVQGFYHQRRRDKGHNIVGIYPSIYRNTSKQHLDSILVIGAHYDTVSRSPGVEDNGSGSVAVLELARLLHKHRCKLNTTIIFVLFDMEEDGLIGSKYFVRNYLFPAEIEKNQVPVKGAIIMDMLLEYDPSINSQMTREIGSILPEWMDKVRQNRFRADFAAVWARRNIDAGLFRSIQNNWLNSDKYKLFLMDPPLPKLGRQLTTGLSSKKLRPYSTFLRSDHSSFWYPYSNKNETINAILLTDLGPWRRKVANKYHSSADNSKLLSKQNLLFLKNGIDSIMATMMDVGNGFCQPVED